MDETSMQHVYVYRIGPFTLSFVLLLASFFALSGLYVIVGTIVTGALEDLFWAVLLGSGLLLGATLLVRWLHQDFHASQTVALWSNKVQLPMTKGEEDSDYLFLNDVLGTKIDKDYHDHGPALIVATKTKPVAYKSMYFNKYESFEDFCERFANALDNQKSQKLDA
ncbi:hypothetical protein [Tateyamaria omphalii]|uniref:hypothetical protein n=1 Tax=Tateyamaria omphalii TaxID=299262 RepID=UPI001E4D1AA9|nr:hypothetical protein [Tateyamaria omphalii]